MLAQGTSRAGVDLDFSESQELKARLAPVIETKSIVVSCSEARALPSLGDGAAVPHMLRVVAAGWSGRSSASDYWMAPIHLRG